MRIAQISTLAAQVRQDAHGSVEALVWLMTRELTRLGHRVTVFGVAGSEVDGELIPTSPGPYGENGSLDDWHLSEWTNLCEAVKRSGRFDVMHSHAYLWGLPLDALSQVPIVHTLHIVPEPDSAQLWRAYPNACVTAISRSQWAAFPEFRPAAVIPHGVDASQFALRTDPDDYVCYLGRFEPGKGPCQAIAAARDAGVRLIMAGPNSPYYREKVAPLVDGKSVEYIGFVKGAERNKLLGGAKALLFPIQYPESFGLVLIESMLCGTPIAAMRLGAVPELIEEGVNGYSADSLGLLPEAIHKCFSLDRARVRKSVEQKFSVTQMVNRYVEVYESLLSQKDIA